MSEYRQESSFGSSHIDQPREAKPTGYKGPTFAEMVMSKKFGERFNESIADNLTDEQAGLLGYYLFYGRNDDAARYMAELFADRAKWLAQKMRDEYQPSIADFE